MQKLLKDISVIPGVAAASVFNCKDGTLYREMSEDLAVEILDDVGAHLVHLLRMSAATRFKIQTMHFLFDRYVIIGLPFQSGSVLLVICAPDNFSLVAATAVMLAGDLCDNAASGTDSLDHMHKKRAHASARVPDKIIYSPELREIFARIEQALAGAVGPVAGMMLRDYIERWGRDGPVVAGRIVELTTALVEEIGDPETAQEFIAGVEDIV